MNVLLVYPRFPDTFWSYSHALWFVGKRAVSPPLGLLTVAAMLPTEWNKRLVDLNVAPLEEPELLWADYVLISATERQRASTLQLVRRCKEMGKRIIAGGPLFTTGQDFPAVDHLVLNEAELTLPPLLADLEMGPPHPRRIYRTSDYAELSTTPVPLWHLLDQKQYAAMSVQYSRGCPFACDFCSVTAMLGRRPRAKSGRQMVAELDALRASGWRGPVFFVDDNLIGPRAAVKDDLMPALIAWQRSCGPTPFFTQVSIDLADDEELLAQMCAAGFDTVFVGIETPDDQSLRECGKHQNRHRDLAQSVRRLQQAGLEVQGGFILGFDHDTPLTFQRQAEFIQRTGIVTAMVGLLQALNGTKLYERLQREKRLCGDSSGDNVDGTTNILPRMGWESLHRGYIQLLQSLYSPRAYYHRVRTFLRHYHRPQIRLPLNGAMVRAFLRSVFYLGIAGQERWQYWRLLIWTAVHRPALFPAAVRLAICGHHYMSICAQHVARGLPLAPRISESAQHSRSATI